MGRSNHGGGIDDGLARSVWAVAGHALWNFVLSARRFWRWDGGWDRMPATDDKIDPEEKAKLNTSRR